MKLACAVVVVGFVSWCAAPWVAMARRGTVDQRTLAACRGPVVPAPRRSPEARPSSLPAAAG